MKTYFKIIRRFMGLFSLAILFATNAMASQANDNTKVVDGVAIHLGIVPEQIVRRNPDDHSESTMHGGVPDKGSNHVFVALFDSATGQPIVNAKVHASVGELGLSSDRETLQPMKVAGTISYGNYFKMSKNVEYLIKISILIPGHNRRVEANFQYENQGI